MREFGISMLCFWVCYAAVTIVGILHTIFNIYVRHMSAMDENGMGEGMKRQSPGTRFITSSCFPSRAHCI